MPHSADLLIINLNNIENISRLTVGALVIFYLCVLMSSENGFTFSMLAYYMLKYLLKCPAAATAGAHVSGYFGGYLTNQLIG